MSRTGDRPGPPGHPFGGLLPVDVVLTTGPDPLAPREPAGRREDRRPRRGRALPLTTRGSARPRCGRALPLVVAGLLAGGALVWDASDATFTDTTSSGGNQWISGTVTVADDDASAAMFTLSDLIPGSTGSRCVVVTYTGSVPAKVRLYATAGSASGSLGPYLDLVVEQGSGGSFAGGCGTFVPSAVVYSGTVDGFASTATSFFAGLGTFAPAGAGATASYRFTYVLSDDNAAQGRAVAIGFTWEARNT